MPIQHDSGFCTVCNQYAADRQNGLCPRHRPTPTMRRFLSALFYQERAAHANPLLYSTGLTAGGRHSFRKATAMACLDRGLADVRRAGGMLTYELTSNGRSWTK